MKKNFRKKIMSLVLCFTIFLGIKYHTNLYFKKNPNLFYGLDKKEDVISMLDADYFETTDMLPNLKTFVPQGVALSDEYMFVSLYDSLKLKKSVIYIMDYECNLVNVTSLDCYSHVGGIAYDEENELLWVSGVQGAVRAYDISSLLNEKVVNAVYVNESIGHDLINYKGQKSIAYMTIKDNKLYVGNFTMHKDAKLKVYDISNSDGIDLKYNSSLSVPSKVQGVTFFEKDNQEYVAFSRSYGSDIDSLIQVYQFDDEFDHNERLCSTIRLKPMLEQITSDGNGNLYGVFESNAMVYCDGKKDNDLKSIKIRNYVKK